MGSNVKSLEELTSHEEARSSGLLLDLEFRYRVVSRTDIANPSAQVQRTILLPMAGCRVLNPIRRIVYIAHHWHGPRLPDNSAGSKLRLIQRALNEDDFVWLDAWSLPSREKLQMQRSSSKEPLKPNAPAVAREASALEAAAKKLRGGCELLAAARSTPAYVFHASQLLVVATSKEEFEQVLQRAWCQTELFAAMCPVIRRESINYTIPNWSLCTRVLRHACKAEALLGNSRDQWHGGDDLELIPLDATLLLDPLSCKMVDRNKDQPTLQRMLLSMRSAMIDLREDAKHEVSIIGIEEPLIDAMLSKLSCVASLHEGSETVQTNQKSSK